MSARALRRITVSAAPAWSGEGAECCAAALAARCPALSGLGGGGDGGGGGVCVRGPRLLVSRGLTDTFSEEKLMRLYSRPKEGRAKYAWVHWARMVAAANGTLEAGSGREKTEKDGAEKEREDVFAGPTRDEEADVGMGSGRSDFVTGLEFVEGWNIGRILVAFGVVLVLSLLATLLWVFFGTTWIHVGFRGAGERVVTGLLLGLLVLFLGWTGVGGWLWVSWLFL